MAITLVTLPGIALGSLSCILGATYQSGTTGWCCFMVDPKTRDAVAPTTPACSPAQEAVLMEGTCSPA